MTSIKFHSIINLITNSSTEMFMDYANSVEPCKEMINAMFKTLGIDKTCDEVFEIKIKNKEDIENWYDKDDYDYDPKNDWEESESSPAMLVIIGKGPKFEDLAQKIKSFLESGTQKEFMT